jgi:hypothetical protein
MTVPHNPERLVLTDLAACWLLATPRRDNASMHRRVAGSAFLTVLLAGCGGASHVAGSTTTSTRSAVETVSVSVVPCPTTFALATQPSTVPLPASAKVSVPASMAATLVVYSDTSHIMALLGPKGWTCSATYGADGSGGIALYTSGGATPIAKNPTPLYPPSSDEAITGIETGGSPVQAAYHACPYFPSAAAWLRSNGYTVCSSAPPSESIDQISSDTVGFEDPPGVAGAGNPSGGPYPANGVVAYSATVQPGTYIGTCTLPQRDLALCTSVLQYFRSLYGGNRPGVPKILP